MNTFKLEIYTPYRLFYADDVESISLTLADGEIGVHAGHSYFTAPVTACSARIHDKEGARKPLFLAKGIIEVKKTKTVLLVNAANWPEEIDLERAEKSRRDAEAILAKATPLEFELLSAKEKLTRAKLRLKLGTRD